MNRDEHSVWRLLKAARDVPPETPAAPPFPVVARILAGWRSAAPAEDYAGLAVLFRRAVIYAVFIMIATIGWNQLSTAHEVPGALALAHLQQAIQIVP
jgi:hypothetical protein